ncbi:MAG: cephalosporin hydroxylase family protein [Sterolibacterium sp.]
MDEKRNDRFIKKLGEDKRLREISREWIGKTADYEYGYHFRWMGRPVIQLPQDILAMQELIWELKPDLIIETGIAHGGSLIFYASMLELVGDEGKVLGLDIDIRTANWAEIVRHPMASRIVMIEGSSIEPRVAEKVRAIAQGKRCVLVCLDSNHTHDHVLKELKLYAPLVTKGSYCVVFDTIIEDVHGGHTDRPWGKGNNPKTAVHAYLKTTNRFRIDKRIEDKLVLTVCPDGYLKRVK